MAQNIYLAAEVLGISACFVNPNVREQNRQKFNDSFVPDGNMFCGAMVLGEYDKREPKKRPESM